MVETQEPTPGKGNVDIPSVVARHPAAVALCRPTALQQSWEVVVGVCDYSKLFTSVGAGGEQVWDKQCPGHSGPSPTASSIDFFSLHPMSTSVSRYE
jgi:hypothetical protein